MNWFDIFILFSLAIAAYVGTRHGIIKQICTSVGFLVGLIIVVLLYEKLAFLSSNSGIRTIVLALLLFAAGLLCYDVFAHIGNRLRHKYAPRWHIKVGLDMAIGGGLALVSYLVTIWFVAVMFSNASSPILQNQLAGSAILSWARRFSPPAIFVHVSHLLGPFSAPRVFAEGEPKFSSNETSISRRYDELDAAAHDATPSIVKVSVWGCGSNTTGTGFVVADRLIMTNAHVIAGGYRISAKDQTGTHLAQAVWFDPELDVSILRTDTALAGKPLVFAGKTLSAGDIGAVPGYAGNQDLVLNDATILELLHANGLDIYDQNKVVRDIYAVRSTVAPGDSGAPLLTAQGLVAGLVFGNSQTQPKTGYAIAASQLAAVLPLAQAQTSAVSTGSCTGK